jgi:FkbM family methyltransferase
MPTDVSLPNGMVVSCLQKHEVLLVNLEVQGYLSNGIRLKPGDTVFDVGANIGLFGLAAYERCERNFRLYAFEPVKAVCDLLRANVRRNGAELQSKVLDFGFSHSAGSIGFAFYPRSPVLSTAYPDREADLQQVQDIILNNLLHRDDAPLALRCCRWLPRSLLVPVLRYGLRRQLYAEAITCEMRTLSQFVREEGIERIDLLKIDVEKAELDVFRGIEAGDWSKIQQVIVEIHDIDHRVDVMMALLLQYGLTEISIEQPFSLKDTNIYTIFAKRRH